MQARLQFMLMVAVVAVPAFGGVIVAPNLGSASSFGMLGGTISNTGTSVVTGNVGAVTTVTGFPPGTATGTVYPAPSNPIVTAAYNDFLSAFTYGNTVLSTQTMANLTTDRTFVGNNVYTFLVTDVTSTANIHLTFDAEANSSEVFIVRVGHDLQVNGPMTFSLINGALAANIYWIVGRDATISSGGGPTTWDGNILAGNSFTMSAIPGGSGTLTGQINGCVFAETANTLAGQTNIGGCIASGSGTGGGGNGGGGAVPEPGSATLMALGGLFGVFGLRRSHQRKFQSVQLLQACDTLANRRDPY